MQQAEQNNNSYKRSCSLISVTDFISIFFLNELCQGKAKAAYIEPQQRKKEESERLRGDRDEIKLIGLRFEKWYVVRFRKARICINCTFLG